MKTKNKSWKITTAILKLFHVFFLSHLLKEYLLDAWIKLGTIPGRNTDGIYIRNSLEKLYDIRISSVNNRLELNCWSIGNLPIESPIWNFPRLVTQPTNWTEISFGFPLVHCRQKRRVDIHQSSKFHAKRVLKFWIVLRENRGWTFEVANRLLMKILATFMIPRGYSHWISTKK